MDQPESGAAPRGRYFDFTPVLIMALASVIGARPLVAIGAGDTECNGKILKKPLEFAALAGV